MVKSPRSLKNRKHTKAFLGRLLPASTLYILEKKMIHKLKIRHNQLSI